MNEVNDTITERAPKGEKIARGRRRLPEEVAASADPVQVASVDEAPANYGGYARWLADRGVKNAYSEAKRRRPDLYRAAMQEALNASQTTVRRK